MAADLRDIRLAIRDAVKAVLPQVQCTGYLLQNPAPPCFEVELGSTGIIYDRSMQRGIDEWAFVLRGFAGTALDETGQRTLDAWLNSSGGVSIKAAIEADRTLGGTVSDVQVDRVGQIRSYSPIANPTVQFYGVEWTLQVITTGD